MTTIAKTCACVLLGLFIVAQGSELKATPMGKVIGLLKELSAKVAAEGEKEAAQYDKYACFCKEQVDEKQYAIEKSIKKLDHLKGKRQGLSVEIDALQTEISKLQRLADQKHDKANHHHNIRYDEHREYLRETAEMNDAITVCEAAIEALKSHKKEIRGAKLDLVQVTSGIAKVITKKPLLAKIPAAVSLLSMHNDVDADGAPKFQYQSNDILATLENMLDEFKLVKKRSDDDEYALKTDSERTELALTKQGEHAEHEIRKKEKFMGAKEEERGAIEQSMRDEDQDMHLDRGFLKEVRDECEQRAQLFDENSQTRAEELKTLTLAIENLEKGAVPNFSANKQLVGLQTRKVGHADTELSKPVTFVQISDAKQQQAHGELGLERIRSFLVDVADRTHSPVLSALSVRVTVTSRQSQKLGVQADYRKVRELIDNLLEKLRRDAESEHDQHEDCVEGMAKATKDRDTAKARIETASGNVLVANGNLDKLKDSEDEYNNDIKEANKAKKEAEDLSYDDIKNIKATIAMTKEGKAAVDLAISLLEGFYEKAAPEALLQEEPVDPLKDVEYSKGRDDNMVRDLRPDSVDTKYHGAQTESRGIIGILEVILNDFTKSFEQAEKDLTAAEEDIVDIRKRINADITEKDGLLVKNGEAQSDVNLVISEQNQALDDANGLLDVATKALSSWETICVKAEETWEERNAKREEEIDALKQALEILDNWKN